MVLCWPWAHMHRYDSGENSYWPAAYQTFSVLVSPDARRFTKGLHTALIKAISRVCVENLCPPYAWYCNLQHNKNRTSYPNPTQVSIVYADYLVCSLGRGVTWLIMATSGLGQKKKMRYEFPIATSLSLIILTSISWSWLGPPLCDTSRQQVAQNCSEQRKQLLMRLRCWAQKIWKQFFSRVWLNLSIPWSP